MRVLFWGTPEFAAAPLRALIGEGHEVVGVVTQPDRPVGRSRSTPVPPPVKVIALEEGIPVLQPEKPRGEEFLARLRALEPEISVVVAYGHILPQAVIDLPTRGTVNIHASLLPSLRGAAPIQAAIRDGYEQTGITIMRLVQQLDAGPVLYQVTTPVLPEETAGELQQRLAELGARAIVEGLALLELGQLEEREQDHARSTYAGKIDREMGRVDWTADAQIVSRLVRAYDPKPGAFTTLRGIAVKLYGARVDSARLSSDPGVVLELGEEGMLVACGHGAVWIACVHPSGRKRFAPLDWAQGRGVAVGDRFDS